MKRSRFTDDAQRAGQQEPGGVLGQGNNGDDCAAVFPELIRPKSGPISPLGGLYSCGVLFEGVTSE